MADDVDVRASEAERSAFTGNCEQCGKPFRGRKDKRFCRDACRTRFGREALAREAAAGRARFDRAVQELLTAAEALGVVAPSSVEKTT